MFYKKKNKKDNRVFTTGFTLVETLVVVGITIIMTTTLIAYTRSSGRQITLYTEQAKLIGILNRAKSLALQREGAEVFCAYGVRFTGPNSYEIVRVPNIKTENAPYAPCDETQAGSYGETYVIREPVVIANTPGQITFEGPYIKLMETPAPIEVVLNVSGSSPVMEARVVVSGAGSIATQ